MPRGQTAAIVCSGAGIPLTHKTTHSPPSHVHTSTQPHMGQGRNKNNFWRHALRKNGFRNQNRKNKLFFAPAPSFARMPELREGLLPPPPPFGWHT